MEVTALSLARRYIGTHEREGAADNPLIRGWLMQAGLGADAHDEIPWCGAFVHYFAWLLDLPRPVGPAHARAWLSVGVPVPDPALAEPGDVLVLSRGAGVQPGPEVLDAPGHVGFFAGLGPDGPLILAGNQGNAVSVGTFVWSQVLGVRRLL